MTIHKAKGLEFETVILPGLGQPGRPDDNALLRWVEREGQTILAPISATGEDKDPIYNYLGHWEKQKAQHETNRLLYVALTRARRNLHLLGCVTPNKKEGHAAKVDSFLRALWPAVSALFVPEDPIGVDREAAPARTIRRVVKGWKVPAPPPAVRWKPLSPEPALPPEITYEWVGDALRHVG